MRALVLSGGGAKGAFQIGVLEVLMKKYGLTWDLYFGVSIGAINASALAKYNDIDIVKKFWLGIKEKDIYKKYGWPKVVWRFMTGKKSIYDNCPLYDTIIRTIGVGDVPAKVGFVSLVSGEYHSMTASPKWIFASSTMPVIWEPVDGDLVDGGVRNVTPLRDAIDAGADEIYVILCNPLQIEPARPPRNLIDVAKRSLAIALNELAIGDIRETNRISQVHEHMPLKKDGTPYRPIKLVVIEPPVSLGDTLDVSQGKIKERMEIGRRVAEGLQLD